MSRSASQARIGRESAVPPRSSSRIRASFVRSAEPHLRVLSDADRMADEIRDIVLETIPPPPRMPSVPDVPNEPITKRHRRPK